MPAYAMRHDGFAAVGAGAWIDGAQGVVSAALVLLGVRGATFWCLHCRCFLTLRWLVANDLERSQHGKARVGPRGFASAFAPVEVYSALGAESAAIVMTQRTSGQGQQELFANQGREVYLITLIHRELQIVGAQARVSFDTHGLRSHDEPEFAVVGAAEVLGASRAGGDGIGLESSLKKDVGTRAIIRESHGDGSVHAVVADRALRQDSVYLDFRLHEGDLLRLGGYVLQPKFHGICPEKQAFDAQDYGISTGVFKHGGAEARILAGAKRGRRFSGNLR